jgi:hypothetical protein
MNDQLRDATEVKQPEDKVAYLLRQMAKQKADCPSSGLFLQAAGMIEQLAAVTAENAALRQDKALVDWLDDNAGMVVYRDGMFAASSEDCCNAGWYDTVRDAIKAAIDAAKGGAK